MFRAKTVLVVGAGASVEVGLPMGSDLLKQIVNLTHISFDHWEQRDGDRTIYQALKLFLNEGQSVEKINEHLEAARQLGKSAKQAISIDNVIDALEDPKVELVGKLGIVRAILRAEASSSVFKAGDRHTELEMGRFADSWYSSLTKLLTENVRKSEVSNIFDNLEIINFNYDRCLEHYLPYSLANYYGMRAEVVQELMPSLIIHRPYGSAGRLPWQAGKTPSVSFGGGAAEDLANVVQQVRTFTERLEEGTELQAMRDAISVADRIVFLGFAFHRQNVALIAQAVQGHTEIVATAFGISKSDKSVIDSELRKAFEFEGYDQWRVELADLPCNQFFKDYWRTLTAERSYSEPTNHTAGYQLPPLNPFA